MESPETSKKKDDDPGHATEPNSSPCCHDIGGRNLIVCIDGTANQYGPMNTNVVELYSLLKKQAEDDQPSWYNSGIGTYARPSWRSLKYYRQVLYHKIDLAIAWNFEKTVMGAYQWLSENYRKGDCIFLFGFSRGAFQVRVLSAMIAKVGLIHKGNALQIPFAYELYADPKTSELETDKQADEYGGSESEPPISPAERFKRTFCQDDVKVHFVGAWDTVSSIGIIRNKKMLPWTVDGMKHVCFFRHALALDERRVKFSPEYAYGGKAVSQIEEHTTAVDAKLERSNIGEPSNSKNAEPKEKNKDVDKKRYPQTKEVWFPGTHSDIGGGNRANPRLNRTRPALRWMVFEANSLGLRTKPFKRDLKEEEIIEVKESLTWEWLLFEYIPFRRLTYSLRDNGKETTNRFHRGKPRKIHPGQKIHRSVLRVQAPGDSDKEYIPQAAPANASPKFSFFHSFLRNTPKRNEIFWQSIRSSSKDQEVWVEFDLYDHVKAQLEDYISTEKADVLESLRGTAVRSEGRQALYEAAMDILITQALSKKAFVEPERHLKIVNLVKEHISGCKLRFLPEVRENLSSVMIDAGKTWKDAPFSLLVELLTRFKELKGHTLPIWSVAFSPDGGRLVSASRDDTLRVWDIHRCSQIGRPLTGHTMDVTAVAYSTDGRYIVSGSGDNTLRKWDAASMIQVGDPWTGHSGWVECIAFSSDGKHVVSGADDRTLRIWDVETGKQVGEPLSGHRDTITSVAFSPDGALIASALYDESIWLWNINPTKPVGEPLERTSGCSVGFSPDGKHIVSGSDDGTIRLWDVQTGQQIGDSLNGHRFTVGSVAFSPNGKLLASGSWDSTVRIWNPKTGKQVGQTLEGHQHWVRPVAFSPDGKLVASASDDMTVRIWDIEDYYALLTDGD